MTMAYDFESNESGQPGYVILFSGLVPNWMWALSDSKNPASLRAVFLWVVQRDNRGQTFGCFCVGEIKDLVPFNTEACECEFAKDIQC